MKENRWKTIWQLYATFFRIGGLTFGGGLTMLPMLKYELVQKKDWVTEEQLLDCYAIGQCTPGIIAVNTATYVGFLKEGILGGIFSTLGMISPSIIIVSLVATIFTAIMDNLYFQYAIAGIKGVVCALMLNTVITLAKKSLINPVCIAVCVIAFCIAFFTKFPTVLVVVIAGIFGIIFDKMGGKTTK